MLKGERNQSLPSWGLPPPSEGSRQQSQRARFPRRVHHGVSGSRRGFPRFLKGVCCPGAEHLTETAVLFSPPSRDKTFSCTRPRAGPRPRPAAGGWLWARSRCPRTRVPARPAASAGTGARGGAGLEQEASPPFLPQGPTGQWGWAASCPLGSQTAKVRAPGRLPGRLPPARRAWSLQGLGSRGLPGCCAGGADCAATLTSYPRATLQRDAGRRGARAAAAAELLVGSALHGPLHLPPGGHPAGR